MNRVLPSADEPVAVATVTSVGVLSSAVRIGASWRLTLVLM